MKIQQMIVVEKNRVSEINTYLSSGYRVVSVTPIIKCVGNKFDLAEYGAYVVVEKEEGDMNA